MHVWFQYFDHPYTEKPGTWAAILPGRRNHQLITHLCCFTFISSEDASVRKNASKCFVLSFRGLTKFVIETVLMLVTYSSDCSNQCLLCVLSHCVGLCDCCKLVHGIYTTLLYPGKGSSTLIVCFFYACLFLIACPDKFLRFAFLFLTSCLCKHLLVCRVKFCFLTNTCLLKVYQIC